LRRRAGKQNIATMRLSERRSWYGVRGLWLRYCGRSFGSPFTSGRARMRRTSRTRCVQAWPWSWPRRGLVDGYSILLWRDGSDEDRRISFIGSGGNAHWPFLFWSIFHRPQRQYSLLGCTVL